MRTIIISFCFLLAALSVKAQSISGIRIDGGDTPILVYLDGRPINEPATSCFIANLRPGTYMIEVYATRYTRPGERLWKGESLYNKRFSFNGREVESISVNNHSNARPGRRPNQSGGYPDYDRNDRVLSDRLFNSFYTTISKEKFDSDRIKAIDAALVTTDFTSEQCLQLAKLFKFDNDMVTIMKKLYPNVVDKQAFFSVVGILKFSSSKEAMNKFIREYNN